MNLYEGAWADATAGDVEMTALAINQAYARAGQGHLLGVQNVLQAHYEGAFTSEQAMTALVGFYALGARTTERQQLEIEAQQHAWHAETRPAEELVA